MLTMDPPQHTRYRKLVNKGFTPRMIGALEPLIRERTVKILEDAIAKGECDFVVDVAAELPLQAIAELIGVPFEDRHKLFDWSNRMIGSEDPEYMVGENEAFAAQFEMFAYAGELAGQRKAEPRDDIITALLNAEIDGDKLTEMEFNLFFLLLSVAGNETTRNAIAHGMNAFLEHPEQWDVLVNDVDGVHRLGDRGDAALGVTRHVLPAQRPAGHHAQRCRLQGRRQGQHLVLLGQPGRGRLRATRSPSTCAGRRTSTSPLAAAVRTSASDRASPAWRSASCSRSWPAGCRT